MVLRSAQKLHATHLCPRSFQMPGDEVTDPRICISDFGEAWLSNDAQPKHELKTPVLFLPPEATLDKTLLGLPADFWTLAYSIYEIMGERPHFEGFMPDRDDIIAGMGSTLGPLRQPWWDARGEFSTQDGVLENGYGSWSRCQVTTSAPAHPGDGKGKRR